MAQFLGIAGIGCVNGKTMKITSVSLLALLCSIAFGCSSPVAVDVRKIKTIEPDSATNHFPLGASRKSAIPSQHGHELPGPRDLEAAKQVDASVLAAVKKYLKAELPSHWDERDVAVAYIHAARKAGDYILLDVGVPYIDDGNVQLIYGVKEKIVVNRFVWYEGG